MKYLVPIIVACALFFICASALLAQNLDCRQGRFYLGNPVSVDRTRLDGYCIDWNRRMFTGYLPGGRTLTRHLEELETLTDAQGQTVKLAPPVPASPPDSLYEVLKQKPLNEMTDREYEYFMLKKKAEIERGSETTTAKAAMMTAEATKSMVSTYTIVAIIGIGLTVILLFLPH